MTVALYACGSGLPADRCCAPLHAGAPASTALALMRSRYTAFVRGDVDYLVATQAEAGRAGLDRAAIAQWARTTTWDSLEIVTTEAGGPDDTTGLVEFIARGRNAGMPFAQRERSRFVRTDGRWYYVDGDIHAAPAGRAGPPPPPRPERNAPCPCGSGVKYKRCHGA